MKYFVLLLLQFLVRGGIEVSATINYRLRPEVYVQGSSGGFHACLSLYHAFPDSYIDIYPWHQTRTIRRWRVMIPHNYGSDVCAFIG